MRSVSVVIPIYILNNNLFRLTKECIDKVKYGTTGINLEIIVVDDCSPEQKYVKILKEKFFPDIVWIHNEKNMGFAHSVNKGIAKSSKELILLLNNDVKIEKDTWLKHLVEHMEYRGWDLTAPKEGWLDQKGDYITYARRSSFQQDKVFTYLVGWCLLIKREVIENAGVLPVEFGKGFWEDTLYCRVIRNTTNYKMGVTNEIPISHLEHTTFKAAGYNLSKEYQDKKKIYMKIIANEQKYKLPRVEEFV